MCVWSPSNQARPLCHPKKIHLHQPLRRRRIAEGMPNTAQDPKWTSLSIRCTVVVGLANAFCALSAPAFSIWMPPLFLVKLLYHALLEVQLTSALHGSHDSDLDFHGWDLFFAEHNCCV